MPKTEGPKTAVAAPAERTPRVLVEMNEDDQATVKVVAPWSEDPISDLSARFGSSDAQFGVALLNQLLSLCSDGGEPSQAEANFMIAAIAGGKPRDEVEAMLIAQMTATHATAMRHLTSMRHAEMVPQLEAHEKAATKMLRSYASQVVALRKYRTGGQQNVEVRHVHVNDGGQAVIGEVVTGGRADGEK